MSKFTTILWDTGGVLLTNGWDHNERKTVFDGLSLSEGDRAEFERLHAVENDPWEKGAIDFNQYLERTLFTKPRPFTPKAVMEAIEAESQLLPNTAMPILQELHTRKEVRMGQLNNESRELNDMRLERFGLKQYLSVFFCSGYVGLRKPAPSIYRLALEVLQAPASEVIFIDDREKNADAARALGIHAICYSGPDALRASLAELQLL